LRANYRCLGLVRQGQTGLNILWLSLTETVDLNVKDSYMNLAFGPSQEKQKVTSGSLNPLCVRKITFFDLKF